MKNLTLMCGAVLMAVLLASCRDNDGGNTGGGDPETNVPVLKVGGILSKTGGAAAYGGDADKGAKLAADEINAKGSLRIEYRSSDDKSDQTEAVKVARTLIDVDGVDIILGPAISPSAVSVGKFANEREIPIVATSATLDDVTASAEYDREYVFRVCFNDSFQGSVLGRFATESLEAKTAAIIYDKTLSYSIGLSATFEEAFTSRGGEILHRENYSVKDTDFSALVDKVAEFDVDVLFIPGWDENVGPMLKQAGSKWDKFKLLGGDGWPTDRLLELAAGNIPECYAVSHYSPEDPTERVAAFNAAFRKKYGEEPSPFAALGYDAMYLLADAAGRSADFDGASLRQALSATSDLELVTGSIRFSEKRNPVKDAVIVRIHPDKIVFHQRLQP